MTGIDMVLQDNHHDGLQIMILNRLPHDWYQQ
jgi:hypothetical protein